MSQCEVCSCATADSFLCRNHTDELRATLTALAHGAVVNGKPTEGLLGNLADVMLKLTRMGGGGGHRKRGDELPGPFEPDTEKGRMTKQGEASVLIDAARNALSTIVRELCEDRGIECPELVEAAAMALWLSGNVQAIALSEGAGQVWGEVDSLRRRIERVIDRPTRRVWLGDCPSWNEHTLTNCGVSLWAPEDAIEVRCPRCKQTHRCQRLQLLLQNDLERKRVPWEKILQANKSQPIDRQIPERTLQSWRHGKNGNPPRLKIRGYKRASDGREVINRHSAEDVPLYQWPDVRKLRDEKPQKKPTGAAARKALAK